MFILDSAAGIMTLRNTGQIWLDSMQVRVVICSAPCRDRLWNVRVLLFIWYLRVFLVGGGRGKAVGTWSYSPPRVELQNECSYTSTWPYVLIALQRRHYLYFNFITNFINNLQLSFLSYGNIEWRVWLRHRWKVMASIPNGIIEIFHWRNTSGRTLTLRSTRFCRKWVPGLLPGK